MSQREITIAQVLRDLAREYSTIVPEREVMDRVLAIRPSQARDPYASIRERLRWDGEDTGWLRLGGGKMIPRHRVLLGLCFRVVPSDDELAEGQLDRMALLPFIPLRGSEPVQFEDAHGRALYLPLQHEHASRQPKRKAGVQTFAEWLRAHHFTPGDSLIVTVKQLEPTILRLEYEPAGAFRADDVLRQERELLDALIEPFKRDRSQMLMPDQAILPIYAQASWRTEYPGRPWQALVEADRRLRLIDGIMIADAGFRRPLDILFADPELDELRESLDRELVDRIKAFQDELRASRRAAQERGVWNGMAPRASTARVIFDMQSGSSVMLQPEPIDALQDYAMRIEEQLASGAYAADEDDWLDLDEDDDDDLFDGDDDDADAMDALLTQNPALADASQKLLNALTPDEMERLQSARSFEEAQMILAGRLQHLMRQDPDVFATLVPYSTEQHHTNNNGQHPPAPDSELILEPLPEGVLDDDDDDSWDDQDLDDQPVPRSDVLNRSNELMDSFYQHLRAQGKSQQTASMRSGDLWVYADFLASYYDRTLDQGDYTTLDECLFFYYPRKVMNGSQRAVREMCTSLKQFYAFLRQQRLIQDDSFAQAMWLRRDQAAQLLDIYEQIDADSPEFDRMFVYLFAPYTV